MEVELQAFPMIRMVMFFSEEGFDPGENCPPRFPIANGLVDFSGRPSTSRRALSYRNAFSPLYCINKFSIDVNKKVKGFPHLRTNYLKYI
jgi:hypothetical protein